MTTDSEAVTGPMANPPIRASWCATIAWSR